MLPVPRCVRTVEAVEHVGQVLGGDTVTGVGDGVLHLMVHRAAAQTDRATCRGVP